MDGFSKKKELLSRWILEQHNDFNLILQCTRILLKCVYNYYKLHAPALCIYWNQLDFLIIFINFFSVESFSVYIMWLRQNS